jgi:hypothetical protein
MSNGGGHPADLAVAAFAEAEFDPKILHCFANANRRIARRKDWLGVT